MVLERRRRSSTLGGKGGRRRRLTLESLEHRVLLTVQPIDLADPSLYSVGGTLASSSPSISTDGQLVAFTSNAENLVPNDTDDAPDAFVYNTSTGTVTLVSVGLNGMAAGIQLANAASGDQPRRPVRRFFEHVR